MTRMQRISRAPVLSATRSLDSCWITDRHLPKRSCELCGRRRSLSCLHDLGQAPVLRLRDRTSLDDLDDLDDDRLVALVRNDRAETLLAAAELVLGLREAHDRLALSRLLALDAA